MFFRRFTNELMFLKPAGSGRELSMYNLFPSELLTLVKSIDYELDLHISLTTP